ncbi:MAG TPA: PepSY domain-containing protein [Candidatus Udaeobacter sp.]|jgi:uncharacterized membrane protein YkoI|nr:PepSY domain-containing protein [Candidatus Udaeobacter sp.]
MKRSNLLVIALVSAGLSLGVTAQAHEAMGEAVDMNSLPAAVQKAIKDKTAGGEIVRVKREDDPNGKWNYEVLIKKDGKETEFEFDPSGKFLKQHKEKRGE